MDTFYLLIGFIKFLMTFPVVVDGGSMIPTFYSDEMVYASAFDVKMDWLKNVPGLGGEGGGVSNGGDGVAGGGDALNNLGIKRGDIIVFSMPGFEASDYYYLKRVIGVPGDKIVIKEGKVYLNEKGLSEPYLRSGEVTRVDDVAKALIGGESGASNGVSNGVSMTSDGKGFVYNVPQGKYFVLGDNRENSIDSRSFVDVYVEKKNIKGKFTM